MQLVSSDRIQWSQEVICRARAFANHSWLPSYKNVFHGIDTDDVPCDTPDNSYINGKYPCGWWLPDQINIGIPYMWGGFSSIQDFDSGVQEGRYAGNVPVTRSNQISKYCVGLDCSGFISKCWNVTVKLSTHTIPQISLSLDWMDQLIPSDIILLAGIHVMLFSGYSDDGKSTARVIDTSRRTGKVLERYICLQELKQEGYRPFRKTDLS